MRSCEFKGCGKPRHVRIGLCGAHYQQHKAGRGLRPLNSSTATATIGMSIEEKVRHWIWAVEDGCEIWVGHINDQGYGELYVGGRMRRAHRVAWLLSGRPLSDDDILDHACGKRSCVRVDHLRKSDKALNGQYRIGLNKNNRTGYRGVVLDRRYGTYSAEVMARGVRHRKAGFKTAEEAHEYAQSIRAEMHPLGDFDPAN